MAEVEAVSSEKSGWFQALVKNRYLTLAFRLILAATFLTSSYGKLVDIERYSVDAVYDFGILPMALARPFGLVMPYLELLCALGLLFGVLTRLSALGIALMSLCFFIAKAIVLAQGRSIYCGCFGAVVDTLASQSIFLDIPMMLLAIQVMLFRKHFLAIGALLPRRWKEKLRPIW